MVGSIPLTGGSPLTRSRLGAPSLLLILSFALAPAAWGQSGEPNPTIEAGDPGQAPRKLRKQPETLLEFAVAGGWMMIPLCACSLVWLGFFFERLVVLRREKVVPRALFTALRDLMRVRPFDRERALAVVAAHPSPAANVFRAALERLDMPPEKIEKAVQNVAQQEVYKLRDHLWIFAIISTVAPLLGLLGTVIGLVQTFREVAISGLGAGATLAPGIYEALVATVAGLATAIPSIAVYYWLHARVDRNVHEMDGLVVQLVEASEWTPVKALKEARV